MKEACKTQCSKCPFRSTSLRGWLGGYERPEIVLRSLWHDQPFFCHTRADYEREDWEDHLLSEGELCVGGLLLREDWPCPESDDPEVRRAQTLAIRKREESPDAFDVMNPREFLDHHDYRPAIEQEES